MAVRKQKLPTPEELLLEFVDRMARHRDGRTAVCVHISKLLRANQRPQHVQFVTNELNKLAGAHEGRVYSLACDDIVAVFKDANSHEVEKLLFQIRYTFNDDPLVQAEDDGEDVSFITEYNIKYDFDELRQFAKQRVRIQNAPEGAPLPQEPLPQRGRLTPIKISPTVAASQARDSGSDHAPVCEDEHVLLEGHQVQIVGHQVDLRDVVRERIIFGRNENGSMAQAFTTLEVDRQVVMDDVLEPAETRSNEDFFEGFIRSLERKLVSSLHKARGAQNAREFDFVTAVHASVETILSPEFILLGRELERRSGPKFLFWMSPSELRKNEQAFKYARDFLHENGHKVGLDQLPFANLPKFNPDGLKVDLLNANWSDNILQTVSKEEIADICTAVDQWGYDRCVVSGITDPSVLDALGRLGLTLFEGPALA